MNVKINLELIRFNSHKDYLPYSCKREIITKEDIKLSDFYKLLSEHIIDFGYEKDSVAAKINNVVIHQDVEVGILCERFGYEWKLESFASHATAKDLIVNRSLINQGYKLVEHICSLSEENYTLFNTLLPFCFVTPIAHSIEDYLGEGFFIFVALMAKEYPHKATELFKLISSPKNGVMNCMLLKGRIFPEIKTYDKELMFAQQALLNGYPFYDNYWIQYANNLKEKIS